MSSVVTAFEFAARADKPIRYVQGEFRAVDARSGDYIKTEFWHHQNPTCGYSLFTATGDKIFDFVVQEEVIDLTGDGQVGLYKERVLRIQHSTGAYVTTDNEAYPLVTNRFAEFLIAFLLDHPGKQGAVEIIYDLEAALP